MRPLLDKSEHHEIENANWRVSGRHRIGDRGAGREIFCLAWFDLVRADVSYGIWGTDTAVQNFHYIRLGRRPYPL